MADRCIPCRGTGKCPDCDREVMKALPACIYCEGTHNCLYCGGTGIAPELDLDKLVMGRPLADLEIDGLHKFEWRRERLIKLLFADIEKTMERDQTRLERTRINALWELFKASDADDIH